MCKHKYVKIHMVNGPRGQHYFLPTCNYISATVYCTVHIHTYDYSIDIRG
jgi:hypothetical protein